LIRLWRSEHVELEVLAPRHVPAGGRQDSGDGAPASLVGGVQRIAEGEVHHGFAEPAARDLDLPIDGVRWERPAGPRLRPHEVLPYDACGGLYVERERQKGLGAGGVAGSRAEAPKVPVEEDRDLVRGLEV